MMNEIDPTDKDTEKTFNYKGYALPVKLNKEGREYVVFDRGNHFGIIFLDKYLESVKPMQQAHQTTHRPVHNAGKPKESDTLKKMKGYVSQLPSPIRHLFAKIGIGTKEEKQSFVDKDLKKLLKDVQGKSDQEAAQLVYDFIPKLRGNSLKDKMLGNEYNELVYRLCQSSSLSREDISAISHLTLPPSST